MAKEIIGRGFPWNIRQLNVERNKYARLFSPLIAVEKLGATALDCPMIVYTMDVGVSHIFLHAVKYSLSLDVRINT
jgi:hypothetical protein